MKTLELERRIQALGENIEKSGLIPKIRELAEKLGEGGKTSEKWSNADYVFEDEALRIHYQVYTVGNQEIDISYKDEVVFHAKERLNELPQCKNPLTVYDITVVRTFEILKYQPGEWTGRIDKLYTGITKILDAACRNEKRARLLERNPEVPEDELKAVQERLGLK